jgi:hypothetical protein
MINFEILLFSDFLGTLFIWPFLLIVLLGIFKTFRLVGEIFKAEKEPQEMIVRQYHYADKNKVFAPSRKNNY